MKPRKQNESDAAYIARIEKAYAEKSRTNERWKKDWKRMMRVLLPASDLAGQIVQYAAEVTGMKDDTEVRATVEGLRALASCVWHEDNIIIPSLPQMPAPQPEKFGGDAEMILKSAIERVKQSRPPWESWRDVRPEFTEMKAEDLDWDGLANEVYDALQNLEFSRGLLRLDMRSAMYDHCFDQISRACNEAYRRRSESNPPHSHEKESPF